jgi:hypothetical protein
MGGARSLAPHKGQEIEMAKTMCPIARDEFKKSASAVTFEIAGTRVTAEPREFSTGSFGWYYTGKISIEVGGKTVPVQVGCNLTVVGSKEAPK